MERSSNSIVAALVLVFIASIACQKGATVNNSTAIVNTNNSNAVNAKAAETPAMDEKTSTSTTAGGTPTDTYKLAYKYRKEKNIDGLKTVFAADVLDFLSEMGKSENKSVDDELRDLCAKPQWTTDESRNEKITGDRATIEYRDEDGAWKAMDMVKEDGKWKLGFPDAGSSEDNPPDTDSSKDKSPKKKH